MINQGWIFHPLFLHPVFPDILLFWSPPFSKNLASSQKECEEVKGRLRHKEAMAAAGSAKQCVGGLCLKCAQNEAVLAETHSNMHIQAIERLTKSVIMRLSPFVLIFCPVLIRVVGFLQGLIPPHHTKGHLSFPVCLRLWHWSHFIYSLVHWLVSASELCQRKNVHIEMSSQSIQLAYSDTKQSIFHPL